MSEPLRRINLGGDAPAEILVILDRSGSMNRIKTDVIGGFNQFLEEQKALPGDARFTLVQFDDMFERPVDRVPLAEVAPLTNETYRPGGGTAIHDATVRGIRDLKAAIDSANPPKIVVAIMTDGQENASRMFTRKDTYEEIRMLREAGALVLFIGANQDALAEGAKLGVGGGQSVSYAAGSIGTRSVMNSTSEKVSDYRGKGIISEYTNGERISAVMPDVNPYDPAAVKKAIGRGAVRGTKK